jgi:hypothetical protein
MSSKAPELRDTPSRPVGVRVLTACLVVYGVQSLAGAVRLFPLWLDAARNHRYGNMSFVWLELATAIAAFTAAYSLWRQRRWARIPALVVVLLAMATLCLIAGFGIGDVGGGSAWLVAGVLLLLALALSVWFLRYIWRHT